MSKVNNVAFINLSFELLRTMTFFPGIIGLKE
jgi:hypothetical protein